MSTLVSRSPSRLLQASDVLLLLVAMVWGTSYGVAKEALVFYPVLGFLAVRFCLTFLILLPQLRGEGRQAWAPWRGFSPATGSMPTGHSIFMAPP